MPRSLAFIPLAKGLDQKMDERLRAPGSLATLTNGYFAKDGAISKRNGFTSLATTGDVASEGSPRGLFSTGDELCVRGYRSLYTWNASVDQWFNRGPLSPFTGTQNTVFHDQRSHQQCDMGAVNGVVGYLSATWRKEDVSSHTWSIVFRSANSVGQSIYGDTELTSNTTATQLPSRSAPKIAASTGQSRLMLAWQEGATAPATLKIYSYDTTNPQVSPVLRHTLSNVWVDTTKPGRRQYDIISSPTGGYTVAWVDNTAGAIELREYTSTHLLSASSSIATDVYEMVGLAWSADRTRLYVITMGDRTSGNIEVWARNANLTANWGPIVVGTYSLNQDVEAVGIVEGEVSAGTSRVVAVWTLRDGTETNSNGASVSTQNWELHSRSMSTAGTALTLERISYNAYCASDPWFENFRCYIAARALLDSEGYSSSAIMDLGSQAGGATDNHFLVGAYDFGVSAGDSDDARQGSLPSVQETATSSSVYRFASTSFAYKLDGQASRKAADELLLDFTAAPMSEVVTSGAAVVCGGFVSWYAGLITEELGYYSGPIIVDASPQDVGGSLASGTYQYIAVYETYDEKGNLLRSVPSPAVSVTVDGTNPSPSEDAVDLTIRSPGLTTRLGEYLGAPDRRNGAVVVYRADTDGLFERCSEPLRALPFQSRHYIDVFRDAGGIEGATVYTQGGAEVDAAGPDGASIVMVGSQRVWLSGFYRRDRVQYSKLYNPGSANEDAIAPEFNETFAYILPRGKRCTGLGEIDDKVIVFTEDEVYIIAGRGPDDGGRNNDFSGLTLLTTDAGCIEPRSVVAFPGGLMFQSKAGIYALSRDLQVSFIGEAVEDVLGSYSEVTSAVLVPSATQVRFTCRNAGDSEAVIIVYDYTVGAWCRWDPLSAANTPLDIIGACIHQDTYYVLGSNGVVWKEDASTWFDNGNVYIPLTIKTGWVQVAQSAWHRVRQIVALCAQKDPHSLTVRLFQDFETTPSQSHTWSDSDINTMSAPTVREQVIIRVKRQKSTALAIELYDARDDGTATGEGFTIAGFNLELAAKRGMVKAGTQQRN